MQQSSLIEKQETVIVSALTDDNKETCKRDLNATDKHVSCCDDKNNHIMALMRLNSA